MSAERDHRTKTAHGPSHGSNSAGAIGVGKQTLTGQISPSPSSATEGRNGSDELAVASRGAAGPGQRLPFAGTIQKLFGRHDVGGIQAHVGEEAAEASDTLGATAYAMDNHVVFGAEPDLHTAAHEAAHVVQGRAGVHQKSGGSSSAPHEQHADAVADRVVAGQSAEDLLDRGLSSSPAPTVQRKDFPDDQRVFAQQAQLATTDVEIPALEGALLSTRRHAVQQGLLSQAAFDESLELARTMAKLQPAITAKAPVDLLVQQQAAAHAQLLYVALSRETSDDKNFDLLPSEQASTSFATRNRYTEEQQQTSMMHTRSIGSRLEQLPGLIRAAQWEDALALYHRLREGLDRWVADRLRSKDKGATNEALGNAQAHYTQMLTGLEQIADNHASRLPAVFHPDAETVAKEKAAGRPTTDTVPVNLYFWKDEATGKYHLRDLTTPSRPHELTIDGPPTATRLATFFEDVARYPRGEVRFSLPSGEAGTAATTGKTKWYEWVAYAGLAIAAAGLALVTAGASVPATVCFAAGAIAGGVSAAGHLVDSAHLGTATTTSIVIDASQIVASFASFGALSIAVKAGGVVAALSQSRWFVPLTTTAAGADVVQLVALTDATYAELARIENGPGTSDDKQRAMSILVTQLIVTAGMAALSVQGARGARSLAGRQLEIVDQNGSRLVRLADDTAPQGKTSTGASASEDSLRHTAAQSSAEPPNVEPLGAAPHGDAPFTPSHLDDEQWLAQLESRLTTEEGAKFNKMRGRKTTAQAREMLGDDLESAIRRIQKEVAIARNRDAPKNASKARVEEIERLVVETDFLQDPEIRMIVERATERNYADSVAAFRDRLMSKILRDELQNSSLAQSHPGSEVLEGVKSYERLAEGTLAEWRARNPRNPLKGLTQRDDGVYINRGEMDLVLVQRVEGKKARILAREEVKTGQQDQDSDAASQIESQSTLLRRAATGEAHIRLELKGQDVTAQIELSSDQGANKKTRGPAGKGFESSLGLTAIDLEKLCKKLLSEQMHSRNK